MTKRKYIYDYPDQREIAKYLLMDDRARMSSLSGLSIKTVEDWVFGRRKNDKLMELALKFQKINVHTILRKEKITLTNK